MIASTQNEPKQKHGKLPQVTPAQLRPAGLGWKPSWRPCPSEERGFDQRLEQWGRCQQWAPMHYPEKGGEDPAGSSVDAPIGRRL